jgi:hypothetical protein
MSRTIALLAFSLFTTACASAPRDVVVGPPRIVDVVVPPGATISVQLPPGEAVVEGVAGGNLHAELELRCADAAGACAKRAADLTWEVEQGADAISLRPSSVSMFGYRDTEASVRVLVPADRALHVRMNAGDLDIRRVSGCLTVKMGAGDVSVEAPLADVRTAHVDANFGDARLVIGGAGEEGRRPLLVGADANWDEGTGPCALAVDLNFGDASVTLY